MNEDFKREIEQLEQDYERKHAEAMALHDRICQRQKEIITNLYATLERRTEERNGYCNAVIDAQDTVKSLTALSNNLSTKLAEKNAELDFKKLLDELLPVTKKIIDACERITPERLENFKNNILPAFRDEISYTLGKLGINLNYHRPGEMVEDFDSTIEVIAQETPDATLNYKTFRSVDWGYGLKGKSDVVRKERVCIWLYKEPQKVAQPEETTCEEPLISKSEFSEDLDVNGFEGTSTPSEEGEISEASTTTTVSEANIPTAAIPDNTVEPVLALSHTEQENVSGRVSSDISAAPDESDNEADRKTDSEKSKKK